MECKYIEEALACYNMADIEASEVTLLRHNENMTFRVGKEYLLQIHEPVEGFQVRHIYEGLDRLAVYETEFRFLAYLKAQGMVIREPVENCKGELITKLNGGITAAVSRWVEGDSLDKVELNQEHYYRIGALTAELHKCADGFQGFPAVSYDREHCDRIKEWIREMEDSGVNSGYCREMQRACDAVGALLWRERNQFRMLHADLSLSNILLTKGGLVPIDFAFLGMGHPMFDIANLFANMGELSCRQKIAEGYRGAGGVIDYAALEACFVLSILGGIAIHFQQWSRKDWFEDRMKRWCGEIMEPFNRGEKLFREDFYLIHAGER